MTRDFIEVAYEIEFSTPFHFGTGLRRGLTDRSVTRDADGYLYLPGSTLKGVVRERCEQIARLFGLNADSPHDEPKAVAGFRDDTDIVDRIFGSRYKPGELYFDNATMCQKQKADLYGPPMADKPMYQHLQTETRTQTSISRLLGTAREQTLYQSEFGGNTLRFHGSIYGHLQGFRLLLDDKWSYSLVLLVAGICASDRIGGNKSTGMGKYRCEIHTLKSNDEPVDLDKLLEHIEELVLYNDVQKEELG